MAAKLITALDLNSEREAVAAIEAAPDCQWFKVGLQLFTRCGPSFVQRLNNEIGKNVFLDLKLHDIPNTVSHAAKASVDLGAKLITVHACGGEAMIAAARKAVEGSETRVLAVTVLTSITDVTLRDEIGIHEPVAEAVRRYARCAVEWGAHGVVASPHEIETIREVVGDGPVIVTPGIRPAWASAGDQARFTTPREASQRGADFVVVGRPILEHSDPAAAVKAIQEELHE